MVIKSVKIRQPVPLAGMGEVQKVLNFGRKK
jgi:hypothetical protein